MKVVARVASFAVVSTLIAFCGRLAAAEASVKPTSVKAIVADGKHNAFTAFVRWKDQFWLAFRKAPDHGYGEADIYVLRSTDGEKWEEALRLNVLPDDRDPQFLATKDRLLLYDAALEGAKLTTYVTYTDDGQTWSKPAPAYEPRFIVWKPVAHGGKYYAGAHRKAEGKDAASAREAHLIVSDDGLDWKKVSTIRSGDWESETTVYFPTEDRCIAFVRQKYGAEGTSHEAQAPFTEWTSTTRAEHLSGHAIEKIDGVVYLFSRTRNGKEMGTRIYTLDGATMTPYCDLPAGGDCSYPGAVQVSDEMLVSYYSSHEGSTNIYLARVPLKK